MRISVKAKPNAKIEKIDKVSNNALVAWIRSPAKEGKANDALLKLLSDYFDIPRSRIKIIKGHASRNKIISIE